MSANQLPKTDSISELAQFWDTHDVTDFEAELEEVSEPVFARDETFEVPLATKTADAVREIAKAQGFPASQLIQIWIDERVQSIQSDATPHS